MTTLQDGANSPDDEPIISGDLIDLRELIREELGRLPPDSRAIVQQKMHDVANYSMEEGRRKIRLDTHPSVTVAGVMRPSHVAAALAFAVLFLLGFLGFWYGMAVGVPHHGVPEQKLSPAWAIARIASSLLMAGMLIRDARRGELAASWAVARQVTLPAILLNMLVVTATAAVGIALYHFFPWLDRSWLYLLPGFRDHAFNLVMLPVHIKYFGILFVLLLAARVPGFARNEELTYRRPTIGWRDGIVRSIRFGLAHCISGVPLYGGLALSVGGLWFTYQYLRGGIERSTLHHATYNWIVLTFCLVYTLQSTIR